MNSSTMLIIAGAVLLIIGFMKSGGQGGTILKNLGINFGGTQTQSNTLTTPPPAAPKTDWIGFLAKLVGLANLVVGLVMKVLG